LLRPPLLGATKHAAGNDNDNLPYSLAVGGCHNRKLPVSFFTHSFSLRSAHSTPGLHNNLTLPIIMTSKPAVFWSSLKQTSPRNVTNTTFPHLYACKYYAYPRARVMSFSPLSLRPRQRLKHQQTSKRFWCLTTEHGCELWPTHLRTKCRCPVKKTNKLFTFQFDLCASNSNTICVKA
jgi:hypothetical protein